jgi:hypothetical protein
MDADVECATDGKGVQCRREEAAWLEDSGLEDRAVFSSMMTVQYNMWEQPKSVITNRENFIGHKDSHQHAVNTSMSGQTDDAVGSCDHLIKAQVTMRSRSVVRIP